jgi:sugar O-acyltransferase (sialic acid O-acetyltransferase NeuD family)
MAAEEVYVAGTGSFAAEVAEWAAAGGLLVAGLVELMDPARVGTTCHGLPVVALEDPPADAATVVGAGGDRRAHWAALAGHGWRPAIAVHPGAHVSASARVGAGCVVGPGAIVGAGTTLGEQVIVNRGALIGHHVRLGDGAVVNPGANVAGHVRIGAGATIGMGALVADHIEVGEEAVVAAGAVVVRPVAAGQRVQGVPARAWTPA